MKSSLLFAIAERYGVLLIFTLDIS